MRTRWIVGMGSLGISLLSALPVVHAAADAASAPDEPALDASQGGTSNATLDQLRTAIEAETDPELKDVMKEQLKLVESGQLDLHTLETPGTERGGAQGAGTQAPLDPNTGHRLVDGLPNGGLVGRPVDLGAPPGSGGSGGTIGPPGEGNGGTLNYMTPELREQLFTVYDGVANGKMTEQEARAKAEGILQEHGLDPHEVGPAHDSLDHQGMHEGTNAGLERSEGFDRVAMEHMSPEAREQMERFSGDHEMDRPEQPRELLEHEATGHDPREFETLERADETPTHEYEAASREAVSHEYEAPVHDDEASQPHEGPEQQEQAPHPESQHPESYAPPQP